MTELNDHDKLKLLLPNLFEGELSDSQVEELRFILRNNPSARKFYARYVAMHALLEWRNPPPLVPSGSGQSADVQTAPVQSAPAKKSPVLGFLGGLGNAISSYPVVFGIGLLAVVGTFLLLSGRFGRSAAAPGKADDVAKTDALPNGDSTPADPVVARLTGGIDCHWDGAGKSPTIGDGFRSGQSLHLAAGVAEIKFDIGVKVIVQSPASFSIDTKSSMKMNAGKLTAEITNVDARLQSSYARRHVCRSGHGIWRRSGARRQQPNSRL